MRGTRRCKGEGDCGIAGEGFLGVSQRFLGKEEEGEEGEEEGEGRKRRG